MVQSFASESGRFHLSFTRGSRWLFALALLGSVLALGAIHTVVLACVAVTLAAAMFLSWWGAEPVPTRKSATALFALAIGLTLLTLVQSLPLPIGVVRALTPATADVWDRALTPFKEPGPAWAALSLDPIATRVQVLRGVVYLLAFLTAIQITARRAGSTFVSLAIQASAVTLALAAVLHPVVGARKVFGLYAPHEGIVDRHIAPLLNPNHLGAYLNVAICLALGMSFDKKVGQKRVAAFGVALFLAAAQIWIASRGATLAMGFGIVLVLAVTRASRRMSVTASGNVLLPGALIAMGAVMLVLGASQDALTELTERDTSKVKIALSGLALVPSHPLFGVGRGAFESAFASVRTLMGYSTVSHPENLFVQWVTEWGVVGAGIALVTLAVALRPSMVLLGTSPAVGPWCAIVVTLVHNMVDFNSEVPAVVLAVTACAAIVVAGRARERSSRRDRDDDGDDERPSSRDLEGAAVDTDADAEVGRERRRRTWRKEVRSIPGWATKPSVLAVAGFVSAAAAIAYVVPGIGHELQDDRETVYDALREEEPLDEFMPLARAAMVRHPAEAYFPFAAGVRQADARESSLPWIERTLELSPVYGPAHFVLATQLMKISPAQARFEYRTAVAQDVMLAGTAIARARFLVDDYDDAMELVPEGKPRANVLELLSEALADRLPATRERLDEVLRKMQPDAPGALARAAEDATQDLQAGNAAPWCQLEHDKCVARGLEAAEALTKLTPGHCEPAVVRARLLVAGGEASRAIADLSTASETASDPAPCLREMAELANAQKDDVYVSSALERLVRVGCTGDVDCASNLAWAAGFEIRRGNPRRAVGLYAKAHERLPDRAEFLEPMGMLAAQLGMHAQALDAFRSLSHLDPDPRWREAADKEQQALLAEKNGQ